MAASKRAVTIDLTNDDDEPASLAPSLMSQQEEEEVEEDEQQQQQQAPLLRLGSLNSSVVGIRYYDGVLHPGEYAVLHREPNNPYDRNAIRVDNIAGIKVGHIKKTVAKALAPVMDRLMPGIQVDATIPRHGTHWELPITLEFFGASAADLEAVNDIFQRNRQHWERNRELMATTTTTSSESSSTKKEPAVQVQAKKMDWQSAQQNLDAMFEKVSQEQLKNLPQIPAPAALTAQLLDHQLDGIRWLYQRETGDMPVPFYKQIQEKGRQVWFSEITNSSQNQAPNPVKGSILADGTYLQLLLSALFV